MFSTHLHNKLINSKTHNLLKHYIFNRKKKVFFFCIFSIWGRISYSRKRHQGSRSVSKWNGSETLLKTIIIIGCLHNSTNLTYGRCGTEEGASSWPKGILSGVRRTYSRQLRSPQCHYSALLPPSLAYTSEWVSDYE